MFISKNKLQQIIKEEISFYYITEMEKSTQNMKPGGKNIGDKTHNLGPGGNKNKKSSGHVNFDAIKKSMEPKNPEEKRKRIMIDNINMRVIPIAYLEELFTLAKDQKNYGKKLKAQFENMYSNLLEDDYFDFYKLILGVSDEDIYMLKRLHRRVTNYEKFEMSMTILLANKCMNILKRIYGKARNKIDSLKKGEISEKLENNIKKYTSFIAEEDLPNLLVRSPADRLQKKKKKNMKKKKELPPLNLSGMVKEFYSYAKNKLGFDKNTKVKLAPDMENASDPLGKTAQYNPEDFTITVFTTGRHPKDCLRSFAHELVHHNQNCRGMLENITTEEGYAQTNKHLREMEKEAYTVGNMLLRDWEDSKKGE